MDTSNTNTSVIRNTPVISLENISKFITDNYGITGKIKPLPSERDIIFKIESESGNCTFKVSNKLDSKALLKLQNEIMLKINSDIFDGISPKPLVAINGEYINEIHESGNSYFCRLFTFVEGDFISELKNIPEELWESLGETFAKIDSVMPSKIIKEITEPFNWDVEYFELSQKHSKLIPDYEKRYLLNYFFSQFYQFAKPKLHLLEKSLIHNDGNDNNILFMNENKIGIIDFGDIRFTYRINELAILISYSLFYSDNYFKTVADLVKGYNKILPLTETETEVLYYFVIARLATSVCMSAYQFNENPQNEYLLISSKDAWQTLFKLVDIHPWDFSNHIKEVCGISPVTKQISKHELLNEREKYIGPSLSISYKDHLRIVRGYAQYLYSDDGKKYLDAVNNVPHVGHCNPDITNAISKEINILNTNTRYLNDYLTEYAEKLLTTLPDKLNVCYFVCSGSEANELALRMARTHTGNNDIIVLDHAYHGNTSLLVDISPYKHNAKGGKGTPNYVHIAELPDVFRGRFKSDDDQAGYKYSLSVEKIINELQSNDENPAAFIAESLPGCGGQIVLPPNYLKNVYKLIKDVGGITIADEVQVGFGRVGEKYWGFELQDVIPDIVTMGKPIGNGHPLAAVVTTREIADSFNNGMEYFNTFGGNPVSCKIGIEVMNIIEKEKLQKNALETGNYLMSLFLSIKDKYSFIGDVRGKGLYIGVEIVQDKISIKPNENLASFIAEELKNRGVLISTDGPYHNVLKLKPPLLFNKKNADFLFAKLLEILSKIEE